MLRFFLLLSFCLFEISLQAQTKISRDNSLRSGEILYSSDKKLYLTIEPQINLDEGQQLAVRQTSDNQLIWGVRYPSPIELNNFGGLACVKNINAEYSHWCSDETGRTIEISNEGQIIIDKEASQLMLSPEIRHIKGQVVNQRGKPIEGVEISFENNLDYIMSGQIFFSSTTTDKDGKYAIDIIEGAELRFEPEKYRQAFKIVEETDVINVTVNDEEGIEGKPSPFYDFFKGYEHLKLGYYSSLNGKFKPYKRSSIYLHPEFDNFYFLQSQPKQVALLKITQNVPTDFLDPPYTIKSGSFAFIPGAMPDQIQRAAILFIPKKTGEYNIKWESILLADQEDAIIPLIISCSSNGVVSEKGTDLKSFRVNKDQFSISMTAEKDTIKFILDMDLAYGGIKPVAVLDIDIESESPGVITEKIDNKQVLAKVYNTAMLIPKREHSSMKEDLGLETVNNKSYGAFLGGLNPKYEVSSAIKSYKTDKGLYSMSCDNSYKMVLISKVDQGTELIDSYSALKRIYSPVESPEEALSFAHLQEGGLPFNMFDESDPFYHEIMELENVRKIGDSFEVKLVTSDPCDLHYEPALSTYIVDKDGNVEKTGTKILTNHR